MGTWLLGLATWWAPLPLGGNVIAMGVAVVWWLTLLGCCAALGVAAGRRTLTAVGLVGGLALFALTFNWGTLAPEMWFKTHRPMYDSALAHVDDSRTQPGSERLPFSLVWLTVDGRADVGRLKATDPSTRYVFFPHWEFIPASRGGYFFSPGGSPAGERMASKRCIEPIELGDGWWSCGMG